MFDLAKDPKELHNAVNDKKYKKLLTGMRAEMIRHSVNGREFVKTVNWLSAKKRCFTVLTIRKKSDKYSLPG